MVKSSSFLVAFLLVSPLLYAQEAQRTPRRVKIFPVPAFGYSPETKTYLGAVSLFTIDLYQDSITRTSNAKIEFNATWNKQVILEADWNYFFKDEKWLTRGLLHGSKYPDLYYGIGANAVQENEVRYESQRVRVDVQAMRKIRTGHFAGGGIRFAQFSNINPISGSKDYSELENRSNAGIIGIYSIDHRNSLLSPTKGRFLELQVSGNLSQGEWYSRLSLDARKYFPLAENEEHNISVRFYQSSVLGEAPFYDLSLLGGDKLVRGYLAGRFRDKHLTTWQTEYRVPLIWRFGLAAFGGISIVYPGLNEIEDLKPNAGMGIRFLVDKQEKTKLRFDYALGKKGDNGFYISFGESF